MEYGKKKKENNNILMNLPPEVFLQIVIFLPRTEVLKMIVLNKRINSYFSQNGIFWKQLCIAQHMKKGEMIVKKAMIEKWKELYAGGYKEMYLSNNIKRLNRYGMVFQVKFECEEESVAAIKTFDKNNKCNIEEQLVLQKKVHCVEHLGEEIKEGFCIDDCFNEELEYMCYDDGCSVIGFGSLLPTPPKNEEEEEETSFTEERAFKEKIDETFPLYMFVFFDEGGNYHGHIHIGNSIKVHEKYWDGCIEYEKDPLFSIMFDWLYSHELEFGDADISKLVREKKTFGDLVFEKLGRKDKYIFGDLRSHCQEHILKYELKDIKQNSFF